MDTPDPTIRVRTNEVETAIFNALVSLAWRAGQPAPTREHHHDVAPKSDRGPRPRDRGPARTGERLQIVPGLRNLGAGEIRGWDWSPDGTSLVYVLGCFTTCREPSPSSDRPVG